MAPPGRADQAGRSDHGAAHPDGPGTRLAQPQTGWDHAAVEFHRDTVRTPDDRFADLPGWTHPPRYVEVDGLRIAYYDVGDKAGPVVLLLHGEPTWSYLYRSMIPPLVGAGLRVIAVDLVGFGRSDKPMNPSDHTYARHTHWLTRVVIDRLELTGINLFCHDWGGLLGLRLVAAFPDRFARVVAANTFLPTGTPPPPGGDFLDWRAASQRIDPFPAGDIVNSASLREVEREVIAAYDAPFPDARYQAGARRFPVLVPITPEDPASAVNIAAWASLRRFDRPFLTLFGDSDPVTRGADVLFQQQIVGAAGPPHAVLPAGHFLQEDVSTELADRLIAFIATT